MGLVVVLAGLFVMHGLGGQSSGLGSGANGGHGAAGISMHTAPPSLMAASSMGTDVFERAAVPMGVVNRAGFRSYAFPWPASAGWDDSWAA
jgi:hypothetical protein